MTHLQGIAASPGIGIGPVHIVDPEEIEVSDGDLQPQAVAAEQDRFRRAIEESLQEIGELREKIALETGEEQARILDAQIEILEDPEAVSQTLAAIERERKPAAFAYRKMLNAVAARLDEADSEYYRGRAIDVRDVRRRVLAHLGGVRSHSLRDLAEPSLIVASELPPEDAQLHAYRSIVEAMNPRPVNIRTLDVGGDKFASYLGTPIEKNPFLGMRGLRFSLKREDIFRTQLRAILRATAHGNVKVMFPMVVGLEDFRKARAIVEQVRQDLRREKVAMAERVPLGVMVETP